MTTRIQSTKTESGYVKVWDDRDCSGDFIVEYCTANGSVDTVGTFRAKWKAEKFADELATQHGCEWGANY
jgi:hypothetical protein